MELHKGSTKVTQKAEGLGETLGKNLYCSFQGYLDFLKIYIRYNLLSVLDFDHYIVIYVLPQ